MATTTNTTLGECRAVNDPSRRRLLGGSVLAALSGAAFASAVVLPDRGEAFPAPNLDAELLATCAAIDALQVQADALYTGPGRIEDDGTRDDMLAPITAQQIPLVDRMCEIRPATLQGHLARARTYWFWDKDPPSADSPYCNEAMQGAILRDLVALAGVVA